MFETDMNKMESSTSAIPETVLQRIESRLMQFIDILPGPLTPEKIIGLDCENRRTIRFIEKDYEAVAELCANTIRPFVHCERILDYFERIFVVHGGNWKILYVSLSVLVNRLKLVQYPSKECDCVVRYIRRIVQSECLISAVVRSAAAGNTDINDVEGAVKLLLSVGDHIANKTLGKNCQFFVEKYPKVLCQHLALIIGTLYHIQRNVKIDFDITSLKLLFCKVLNAYGKDPAVNLILQATDDTKMWSLAKTLIKDLDRVGIERIAWALLTHCNTPVEVWCYLGNYVNDSSDLKFMLTTKFIILNYYDTTKYPRFLPNLIGYLTLVSPELVIDVLIAALSAWSDKTAITGTPVEQRLYLSEVIVLCVKKGVRATPRRDEIRRKIMEGVPAHLDCTAEEIRAIGMATAEIVVPEIIELKGEPLKFDFSSFRDSSMKLVNRLRGIENIEVSISEMKIEEPVPQPEVEEVVDDDLDSDDDLVPYDTSNDVKKIKGVVPKYLRDLIAGLADKQNAENLAACKEVAVALIRDLLPNDDVEVATELLDLTTDMSMVEASVEIVCVFPAACAAHLAASVSLHRSVSAHVFTLSILEAASTRLYNAGKFTTVADSFFFPLIQRKQSEDAIFIGKLLRHLARVLHYAANTVHVRKMADELLQIVVDLKSHGEAEIRLAAMASVAAIVQAAPDMDLSVFKSWLSSAARNDPDDQCRQMAGNLNDLLPFRFEIPMDELFPDDGNGIELDGF